MRVSASGGKVVAATTLEPQQSSHRWPLALPDGRRFLFYVFGAPATAGIYLGALRRDRPDPADARRQRRGVSTRGSGPSAVFAGADVSAPIRFAKAGGCCGCGPALSWRSGWT